MHRVGQVGSFRESGDAEGDQLGGSFGGDLLRIAAHPLRVRGQHVVVDLLRPRARQVDAGEDVELALIGIGRAEAPALLALEQAGRSTTTSPVGAGGGSITPSRSKPRNPRFTTTAVPSSSSSGVSTQPPDAPLNDRFSTTKVSSST